VLPAGEAVVKSIGRVFAVLELFERADQPMNALTIAKELKLPTSSNFSLLKSMVTLGYLNFDRAAQTYFPTIRLSFLGHSFSQKLGQPANIFQVVDRVRAATGETAGLSCENDVFSHLLRVRDSDLPNTYVLDEGDRRPLFTCSPGIMLLATKTNQEIARMSEKLTRRKIPQTEKTDLLKTLALVEQIRGFDTVTHYDTFFKGASMIMWLLDKPTLWQPLVLSVSGPTKRIKVGEGRIIAAVDDVLRELDLKSSASR
jgi:DNA-binding IclR family transcriptional regulator